MCGRFAQVLPPEAMMRLFDARDMCPEPPAPSWNVAPAAAATTVVWDAQWRRRLLLRMRWGFVASWQRHPESALVTPFNARCETVATSRMFAPAFKRRRCLVPVAAWYEWARAEGQKVPHALARADGAPVAIGGVWEIWGSEVWNRQMTFAVVTTPASDDVRGVHERMPLVVEQADWPAWLGQGGAGVAGSEKAGSADGDPGAGGVAALMRPAASGRIAAWRVGRAVGNPRNNGAELLAAA